MVDSIIISYLEGTEDKASLLIVGKKKPNQMAEPINVFSGGEADDIWKKLTVKEDNN